MNYLESDQAEQLQAIGAKLSQTRQEKGISLEEIATNTFIPQRLLKAIEAGRLDLLPEPVFVQGFIRRFATEVGLDGLAVAQEFSVAPPIAPVVVEETPPEPTSPQFQWLAQLKWNDWLPLLGMGLALVLIIVIVVNMTRSKGTDTSPKAIKSDLPANSTQPLGSPKEGTKSQVVSSSGSVESGASGSKAIAASTSSLSTNPEANNTGSVELKLNFVAASWVSIEADGKLEYEGTLEKGGQKTWKAKKQLVMRTGNAGGVSASFNGSVPKLLGSPGSTISVSYPPKGTQLAN